jgi:hypothetical protein
MVQDRTLFSSTSKRLQDKAIDQLYGICAGILADGEVSPKEAEFVAYAAAKIRSIRTRISANGHTGTLTRIPQIPCSEAPFLEWAR